MIRIQRDPYFWHDIVSHPDVASRVGALTLEQIALAVGRPDIVPLAAEHGGFWFKAIDSFARVRELHTLFTPEGWGREVHAAAKAAFAWMFDTDCDLIVTAEMQANRRSQPPRTFGFRPVGDFVQTHLGEARTWMLTKEAWTASPARRTTCH